MQHATDMNGRFEPDTDTKPFRLMTIEIGHGDYFSWGSDNALVNVWSTRERGFGCIGRL